jgi:hypothetical protein
LFRLIDRKLGLLLVSCPHIIGGEGIEHLIIVIIDML